MAEHEGAFYACWKAGTEERCEPPAAPCVRGPRENEVFEVCIDATPNGTKPPAAPVSQRVVAKDARKALHLWEIARALSVGCSVMPGVCEGGRKKDDWLSQQLFFIDFDNDDSSRRRGYAPLSMDAALNRAWRHGLEPRISYQTFSGTDSAASAAEQRFRLVFASPSPISALEERDAFLKNLLRYFPEADEKATDPSRLYYGTNKEVIIWNKPLSV